MSALTERLSKLGNGTALPDPSKGKPADIDMIETSINQVVKKGNGASKEPSVAALCTAVQDTNLQLGDLVDQAERVQERLIGHGVTPTGKLQHKDTNVSKGLLADTVDESVLLLGRLERLSDALAAIEKAVG